MQHALPAMETQRLILRPRTLDDLDRIALLNADPAVMRHIAPLGSPSMSREGVAARSFVHVASGLGYWSVFSRSETDELLGYVGLIPDEAEAEGAQLSYRFATRHWNKGYAFEATARLVRYGLHALALLNVTIVTHPDNEASCRLAQKLGFTASDRIPYSVRCCRSLVLHRLLPKTAFHFSGRCFSGQAQRADILIGDPPVPATSFRLMRQDWLERS